MQVLHPDLRVVTEKVRSSLALLLDSLTVLTRIQVEVHVTVPDKVPPELCHALSVFWP